MGTSGAVKEERCERCECIIGRGFSGVFQQGW